ncbi:MAG TPA: hypothetical protein DCM87_04565 [Planctomycetes bacterium]|nr:hypothetical protein [Planctomycetota bacterium]
MRGDTNRDGTIDIADAISVLSYLFGAADDPSKAYLALCLDACDINDNGAVDIADPIYVLTFLFAQGTPPPVPYPDRGEDPTPDSLGCGGLYTAGAFRYVDPKPPSYQPLSHVTTTLVKKDDLAAIALTGSRWVDCSPPFPESLTEHPLTVGAGISSVFCAGAGQIDDDPEEEIVALAAREGNLVLVVFEGGSTVELKVVDSLCPSAQPQVDVSASIALGNVDNDDYDEIALSVSLPTRACPQSGGAQPGVQTRIYVFDDRPHNCTVRFAEVESSGVLSSSRVTCGDVDADMRDEVILSVWEESGQPQSALSDVTVYVVDGFEVGAPGVVGELDDVLQLYYMNLWCHFDGRVVAGNFNPAEGDEILVTKGGYFTLECPGNIFIGYTCLPLDLDVLEYRKTDEGFVSVKDPVTTEDPVMSFVFYKGSCPLGFEIEGDIEVEKADLNGDGIDELVVFSAIHHNCLGSDGRHTASLAVLSFEREAQWAGGPDLASHHYGGTASAWIKLDEGDGAASRATLAVGDIDADGRDEVFVRHLSYNLLQCVEAEEIAGKWTLKSSGMQWPSGAPPAAAHLAVGDFDGDSLVVRHTGQKQLSLGDPLPIVLMAAPPWKEGTSQRYDWTWTNYSNAVQAATAVSVESGVAITGWLGFEAGVDGIASVSAKVKIGYELEKTHTDTTIVGSGKGFTSGYDDECLVFQGTLYNSYAYEILSPPEAVVAAEGRPLWLDIPVATMSFMWGLDYFNRTLPDHAIDRAVLGEYTLGSPDSYLGKVDAAALVEPVNGHVGWISEENMNVCSDGLSSTLNISLGEEHADETSRSWSITGELEVKCGPVIGGVSIGGTRTEISTVTVDEQMTYTGSVGCIEDDAEHSRWMYSWGLLVYNPAVFWHPENAPGGNEKTDLPFQVLTYWVTPQGPGYGP